MKNLNMKNKRIARTFLLLLVQVYSLFSVSNKDGRSGRLRNNAFLKVCLIVLVSFTFSNANAEIFRWVDVDGGVHYGDEPPASSDSKEIKVNIENNGMQLSSPEQRKKWGAEVSSNNKPSIKRTGLRTLQNVKPKCKNDRSHCFSEEEDQVCLLRWGISCEDLFFWQSCSKKRCAKKADICTSPYHYLDYRPVSVNSRDLGRRFPTRKNVSDGDWQCLLKTGLYCDEYSDEVKCDSNYTTSCDKLETWVAAAIKKCKKNKMSSCDKMQVLVSYRPIDVEERKRTGHKGGRSGTIRRDILMEKRGFTKRDLSKAPAMQDLLDKLPLRPAVDNLAPLECVDSVDDDIKLIP